MRTKILAAVIVAAGLAGGSGQILARQVLSPSVNKPISGDKEDNGALDSQIAPNNRVEPSRQVLIGLDSMIPDDVIGSDLETPLMDIARDFVVGRFEVMEQKIDKLCSEHPELPPKNLLIAGMLFTSKNNAQGRVWLEKTALENPEYPTTYAGFAKMAITERRTTDAAALLDVLERKIAGGKWSPVELRQFRIDYLDGRIDVAVQRQELEQAKTYLQELEALLPEDDKVMVRIAQVEFDLGNINTSLDYLRKAKQKQVNIRVPEVVISDWYRRKNMFQESEKFMVQAAQENPEDANVQLEYARWLLLNERFPQALEAIKKADSLQADSFTIEVLKGQVSFARRSYNVAEMHFENLVRQRPADADSANMLALCLAESKLDEKKNRALEIAVINQRLYPRSPSAMATLGWIHYRLGNYQDAERAFSQITASKSLDATSSYFVATFLVDQKKQLGLAKQLLAAAINEKSYFMFRNSAKELLDQVEKQIARENKPPEEPDDNQPGSVDK